MTLDRRRRDELTVLYFGSFATNAYDPLLFNVLGNR